MHRCRAILVPSNDNWMACILRPNSICNSWQMPKAIVESWSTRFDYRLPIKLRVKPHQFLPVRLVRYKPRVNEVKCIVLGPYWFPMHRWMSHVLRPNSICNSWHVNMASFSATPRFDYRLPSYDPTDRKQIKSKCWSPLAAWHRFIRLIRTTTSTDCGMWLVTETIVSFSTTPRFDPRLPSYDPTDRICVTRKSYCRVMIY